MTNAKTLGGSGDYNLDFLMPLARKDEDFIAIYRSGIRNDRVDWSKIVDFLRSSFVSGSDDGLLKEIIDFYGLKPELRTETNDQLISCIYNKSFVKSRVVTRESNPDLRAAFQSYCKLIQINSKSDFTNELNSGRSKILFLDLDDKEYRLEAIQMLGGDILLSVRGEWLKADEIFQEFSNVRFTGDLSIIQQLEFGLPSFIPWYVRARGKKCGHHAEIDIAEQFLPIYALRLDRRAMYYRSEKFEQDPWGLLWDLFDFTSPRRTVGAVEDATKIGYKKPRAVEDILMRAALKESVGAKRRRTAARDTIDGLEHSITKMHSPAEVLNGATSILGNPSYFSIEFHLGLSFLLKLRTIRTAFLEDCSIVRSVETFDTAKQRDGVRRVLFRLKRFISNDTPGNPSWTTIAGEDREILRDAVCSLRERLVDELIDRWVRLEATYRASPYKVFALLPFYELREDAEWQSESKRSFCLLCGRL